MPLRPSARPWPLRSPETIGRGSARAALQSASDAPALIPPRGSSIRVRPCARPRARSGGPRRQRRGSRRRQRRRRAPLFCAGREARRTLFHGCPDIARLRQQVRQGHHAPGVFRGRPDIGPSIDPGISGCAARAAVDRRHRRSRRCRSSVPTAQLASLQSPTPPAVARKQRCSPRRRLSTPSAPGRPRCSRRQRRQDHVCYRTHSQRSRGDAAASVAKPSAIFRRHFRLRRRRRSPRS